MKQIKSLVGLSVFAIIGFASLHLLLQKQDTTLVKAAPGDVVVQVFRAGDNQFVPNANIVVNCPAQATNIVLTENPPASGNYVGSFVGQCNNGDGMNADIQIQGFVDQSGINFLSNYNPGVEPDCATNTNCLTANNFQPGLLVNLEDIGSNPITGGSVNGVSVPCYEAPGGVYLCTEPEGAGCPTTDTANASAPGFLGNNGNYNRRCNGNDAQSQITIQLAVDPNASDGGGFFNILQREELADPFDRVDLPSTDAPAVDIQITELKLESVDPIEMCPFQTNTKGMNFWDLHIPENAPILPQPGEVIPPSFFEFKNQDGNNERIEFHADSTNPGNNNNWFFSVTRDVYEPAGILLRSTEYEFIAGVNNNLTSRSIFDSIFFDEQTKEPAGFSVKYEYDANGNITDVTRHPDFDETISERVEFDERDLPPSALEKFVPRTSCDFSNQSFDSTPIDELLPPEKETKDDTPEIKFTYDANSDRISIDCRLDAQGVSSVLGSAEGAGIETFVFSKLFAPGITEPGNLPIDLVYFIACDDETTNLGLGERLGVVNSFTHVFNRVPLSTDDWIDILLIADGSEPLQNAPAEKEDDAVSQFVKLYGRQPNPDDPRDAEKLDQLIFGIRPLMRDLEKEYAAALKFELIFGYSATSNNDWNAVRALAYGSEVIDLNELDRQLESVRNSLLTGPCTEEEIAALNAQKAALEAEAASLMAKQAALKGEIKACNEKKAGLEKKSNDAKTKADQAGKKAKTAQDAIDKADQDIKDLEKDIKNLQEVLAGGDKVETKTTSDPLGGISSGAAITFDGGITWVVATGEGGAQQLAENLSNNPGIVKDLQNKKADLKNKKADKKKAEADKAKAEKEKADAEKEKTETDKQIEAKKQDTKKKEKDLDAIGSAIDALNAKIAEFNAVAAKCDIAAAAASRAASERLNEAKRKLDRMPPDDKEEAEDLFEDNATDAEENADSDAGYAGGTADNAAKKLEDAMRAASSCPEGHIKCGETFKTGKTHIGNGTEGWFQTLLYLRGSGLEGDKEYNKMVNDIQGAFDSVDSIEKFGLAVSTTVDVLAGGSVLNIGMAIPGLVYGAWSDIARQAALNKIAEIRNIIPNPAIDGDLFFYGGWDKYSQDTRMQTYKCIEGIYQYNGSTLVSTAITCEYRDPAITVTAIPDDRLPDYSEKENGHWRNPESITKFSEWRSTELEKHQPFGPCKESFFEYSPSCG